jgi:hypothetical protein
MLTAAIHLSQNEFAVKGVEGILLSPNINCLYHEDDDDNEAPRRWRLGGHVSILRNNIDPTAAFVDRKSICFYRLSKHCL